MGKGKRKHGGKKEEAPAAAGSTPERTPSADIPGPSRPEAAPQPVRPISQSPSPAVPGSKGVGAPVQELKSLHLGEKAPPSAMKPPQQVPVGAWGQPRPQGPTGSQQGPPQQVAAGGRGRTAEVKTAAPGTAAAKVEGGLPSTAAPSTPVKTHPRQAPPGGWKQPPGAPPGMQPVRPQQPMGREQTYTPVKTPEQAPGGVWKQPPGAPPGMQPVRPQQAMGRGQPSVPSVGTSGAGAAAPAKSAEKEVPVVYGKGTYNKYKDSLTSMKPALRPDKGGEKGDKIRLWANHFELKTGKVRYAYHYDIEVLDGSRPMINKAMRRRIVYQLLNDRRYATVFPTNCCAFDGMKSMYSNQKLKIDGKSQYPVTINEDGRDREFTVEVQYAAEVDLATIYGYLSGQLPEIPQRAVQCMDIVLRYNQTYNAGFLPVQRSLFNPNRQELWDLGGGVLVWSGHYQSVRMGSHLFLNIDMSQKAMYTPGPVVDRMYDVLNLDQRYDPPELERWQIEQFSKHLKGLKVKSQVGNVKREYRVNGLKGPAKSETFDWDGKMVTVQQYYKQNYAADMKYPHLPCLWVGNVSKTTLVPMEFCEIKPGQVMRGKLNDKQTSEMIKYAAKPPDKRREAIESAVRTMNPAQDPVAQNFGFSVAAVMTKVEGRVLSPPVLEYSRNTEINPTNGKWDMRSAKFLESAGLQSWGVLDTTRIAEGSLMRFLDSLKKKASQMGMTVENELFREQCRDQPAEVERKLLELKRKYPNIKLVLVPIARKGHEIYKDIKRVGDLLMNVTTQCCTRITIDKCQDQTVANLLMKINAKLGGVNNYIHRRTLPEVLSEPVLILGADVTHPAPDARREGKPSIAAVVGSSDVRAMKYSGELRLQDPGREIIEELEDMVYKLLMKFYQNNRSFNNGKPKRIIFYRDGVSEGQFAEVLRWEFNAVRRACKRIGGEDYSPAITFLVVQKRHNTRLFADRSEMGRTVGRMKNIPPGTVVDTKIVHGREFSYFLCSHEGIQGTSRPTHYHVLFDENGFTSDTLETLTYYLCHLFARCTRSVSNPAPSYYAHLLAFRGRHHHDSMIRTGQSNPKQLVDLVERSSKADPMFYV